VLAAIADTKPHLDHLLFAWRQRLQHRVGLFLQVQIDNGIGRRNDLAILDEISKMRIFLFANRRFERDWLLRNLENLPDFRHRDVHPLCDFFRGRLAAELLHQRARGPNQLVDRLDHVDRDANRPGLVGNRAGDCLPNPPRRVGRELVAAPVLELVDRLHEPDVAFLNQIEELKAAVCVLLGNRHHQAEVRFDEFFFRLLRLDLAARDGFQCAHQLIGCLLELVGHGLHFDLELFLLPEEVLLLLLF
jgi:hypothetical protein